MSAHPIAVIGAGLAGLTCARALIAQGASVRLFDKGRGAGGRLATRRVEANGQSLQFDHGAQYLTARGPGFGRLLADNAAQAWGDHGWLVGTPGMSGLPRALARGLDLTLARHVTAIEGVPGAWTIRHLASELVRPGHPLPAAPPEAAGPFRAVAIALPASQAAPLIAPHAPAWLGLLAGVHMAPCWTLLAAFAERLPLPDANRPGAGPIGWAARDSAKPGRDPAAECWVVQASPDWSRTHLEAPPETVMAGLLAALGALADRELPKPIYATTHRWRHSLVETPLGRPCLHDPALGLGLAGDWCIAGRAEAAYDSGLALAAALTG